MPRYFKYPRRPPHPKALVFECPKCGAPPGESCAGVRGPRISHHRARWRLGKQLKSKLPRPPISPKLRFKILRRDKFVCQYCGRRPPDVALEIDHIVSVYDGGKNDEHNLITACHDCNIGKGRTSLESGAWGNKL